MVRAGSPKRPAHGTWFGPAHRGIFATRLSFLLEVGVPLPEAIRSAGRSLLPGFEPWTVHPACERMAKDAEEGRTLSEAMAGEPRQFSPWERELVRGGERAGRVAGALRIWAGMIRRAEETRRMVWAAAAVPLTTLFVLVAVATLCAQKVLPTFLTLYVPLGGGVPAPTTALSTAAAWSERFLAEYPAWILSFLAFLLVLALWGRLGVFAEIGDRVVEFLPGLRGLRRRASRAALLDFLASFLEAGGTLPEVLRQAARAERSRLYAREIEREARAAEDGRAFPSGRRGRILDRRTAWALRAALASPDPPAALRRLAAREGDECSRACGRTAAWFEPLLVIGVGLVAAFVILGTWLPLVSIWERMP